jgi:ribonucleoside-diphosphate reductase alpha chain
MIFKMSISEENWKTKYRYKDEDPAGTFKRVARAAAEVERKFGADDAGVEKWADAFFRVLVKVDESGEAQGLKSTPGGRITANLGTEYKKVTPWNCFIESPVNKATITYSKPVRDKDVINVTIETGDTPDNLSNIFLTLLESAETLKSEGGIGLNFGFIRPRGSLIKGVGIRHPGVVSYMELWDKMSEIIVKGDNDGYVDKVLNHLENPEYLKRRVEKVMPRKGAMMAILPIWHPDVEEFIRAKQTPGKLTKFNISVLVDDAFMQAVEEDGFYDLHFNGKVYKQVKARDMYELIMVSTYNRAEPGVVFLDNANRINPLLYLGPETATNPCVAAGTLVATDKGLVPVEDIKTGDMIQTVTGFGPVKTIEVHENYPVYKVTFSDGLELRVTEGHIFHVMQNGEDSRKKWNKDVRLKDLKVGDYVRKEPYRFNLNNRTDLTRNDGFLAGYWLGDGCRSEKGTFIKLSANSTEDNSFLERALQAAGMTYGIDRGFEGNTMTYSVQSLPVAAAFFEKTGLNPDKYSFEKAPPTWWLNTNKEFLAGVLDGLISSDGNINLASRYPAVRFKSTSKELHNFMRELLLIAGADYKLYDAGKTGEETEIYGRTVTRRHDIWEGQFFNNCAKNVFMFTGGISHPAKNEMFNKMLVDNLLEGTKWKAKIRSIEPDGVATVYDLYEESTDTWNTHGLINRGCGEIPGSAGIDAGYRNYAADYLKPYLDDTKDFIMGRTTVCLLGSMNLTMYVNKDRSFDYEQLKEDIKIFARFLENINEFTDMLPLPAYKWAVQNIRQYGMGFNGIGSTLFMMGHAYNSKEAEDFLHKIHFVRDDETLRASALLAKERGPFPMFSQEYLETPYFTKYCKASEDAKDLARKHGVRNAKRLTNPPLGNTSVICNNISNGIEPVFSFGYERTVMSDAWPEGMTADNVRDLLPETKIGDATVWRGEYKGRTWYYEPHNRGLCFIEPIQDYGYRWVLENYPEDIENNAEYLCTAQSLSVMDHVKVQAICQEYCDQSISKTASVPNEYPFEDFKQLYMEAWKSGLVGFTTYRSGTMEEVLSVGAKQPAGVSNYLEALKEAGCIQDNAELTGEQVIVKNVKLPEEFDNGETHIVKREGNKYYIHFSYLKNFKEHPIALWIYSNNMQEGEYVSLNRATRSLQRLLIEKGVDVDLVLEQVEKNKDNPHHERLGKMVGMALRHNIDIRDVAHALEGIEGDYISSTLTAVRKFLKKHVKDGTKSGKKCESCGSEDVIYEGGCDRCLSCGNSGCA